MQPTNTLFIFSDQHDPRYIRANGCSFIHTPNLDRLIERGVNFTNAYTPSPICVPARASVMNGKYPHQTGYWDNCIAYDGRETSWAHRMAAAGVRVESVGKLHFRDDKCDVGFQRQQDPMHISGGVGPLWSAVRDPLPATVGRSPIYDDLGEGLSSYNRYDLATAGYAADWLRACATEPQDKPWFLHVGFVAPHMPLVVPQKYLDLYPVDSIKLPKLLPQDGYVRHPWVERKVRYWDHGAGIGSEERRRLAMSAYFGLITFLDEQLGLLIRTLDETNLWETTRVVYTSDHGDNLGTRGLWNKDVFYRESVNIPMVVAGPGVERGAKCSTNVNLIDLYPTFLESAGIPLNDEEKSLSGRSLFSIASEPSRSDRLAFSEYHAIGAVSAGFMLATGKYKFHYYVGQRPELFDLEADPEELVDLVPLGHHGQIVAEFERLLRDILDPEAIDRRAKDDQNALVRSFGGPEAIKGLGNSGATPTPAKFQATLS